MIADIVNKEAVNCTAKINYLNEILTLMNSQISRAEGDIKVTATEIEVKYNQIKLLEENSAKLRLEIDSDARVLKM